MSKLKVFSGLMSGRGKVQVRAAVATTSQKRVSELTGVPLSRVRSYWSITGNADSIRAAMSAPETVFLASDVHMHDFEPR